MTRDKKSKKKKKKKYQSFGSFQDLAWAMGGGEGKEAAPESKAEPGWTLHRAGDDQALDLDKLPETRSQRPLAFGPMSHGPKPYQSVDSEEMQLFRSFRVRTVFPDDVQKEVG